ncbi:MAG: EamA family transporter [Candidatus Sericytochromatia bacterium]
MNASTLALTAITIFLWGLIPILDKLALSQFHASPLVGIAIRATAVAVLAVPLAIGLGEGSKSLREMPPAAIALFVASGVVSLLLSQFTYYKLLQQANVSRVFPFLFSAAPLVTILIGVLFLKEPLSLKQALGAALVIGGGLLLL